MDSKELFGAQMANHQERAVEPVRHQFDWDDGWCMVHRDYCDMTEPGHVHVPGQPDYMGGTLGEVVTRCKECGHVLACRPSRIGAWAE